MTAPTPAVPATRIAEIEQLAKAATDGPWVPYDDEPHGTGRGTVYRVGVSGEEEYVAEMGYADNDTLTRHTYGLVAKRNAAFIAGCDPQTILALCALARGASQDAARLDAIERGDVDVDRMGTTVVYHWARTEHTQVLASPQEREPKTLREAIDAAISFGLAGGIGVRAPDEEIRLAAAESSLRTLVEAGRRDTERLNRLPAVVRSLAKRYNWREASPLLTRAALDVAWQDLSAVERNIAEAAMTHPTTEGETAP